jgi:DNA invertase Pin-like site-specific DNA recombinase
MSNKLSPTSSQFPRCAHYGRCATTNPAALEEQERLCRDFATRKGWLIPDEHIYQDAGISGMSEIKGKGLEALEAAARKHPRLFDCVLVYDTWRLGRDPGNVLAFVTLMQAYGIKVRFVGQDLDSNEENFELLLTMFSFVEAQIAARQRSKIHSPQKGRRREVFTASEWPYGYTATVVASPVSPDSIGRAPMKDKKLEINEGDAEMVRCIFQLHADGCSLYEISLKLLVRKRWPQNSRSAKTAR